MSSPDHCEKERVVALFRNFYGKQGTIPQADFRKILRHYDSNLCDVSAQRLFDASGIVVGDVIPIEQFLDFLFSAEKLSETAQATPDSSLKAAFAVVPQEQASRLLAALDETGNEQGDGNLVVTLLSGRELLRLQADASWTGAQVKSVLGKYIDKESLVKELRAEEQVLGDGQTLSDLGLATRGSWKLQVILESRPNHALWLEFKQRSPCPKYLHRILIADDVKAAGSTIKLLRDVEASHEDNESGRVQFLLMARDQHHGSSEQVALIPPDGSYTDVTLIVNLCASHSIDAVIVGPGSVAGGDMQLVHNLKKKLAEKRLEILVFGPSSSVDTPPIEPSGGWTELATTPPAGTRVSTYCLHCQGTCEAEIGEYISCHINPKDGAAGFQNGYPCSSWLHCVRCGGAVEIPHPGWWNLMRFDRSYVFRSSDPEAGSATFALCGEDSLTVKPAVQTDGEWMLSEVDSEESSLKFYEEAGSYLERLGALWVEQTNQIGPSRQITFKLRGNRRLSMEEAKERARLAGEEFDDEDPDELEEIADVKTGKWMGVSHGIQWDDGEMWHCLGTLKYEPEEE